MSDFLQQMAKSSEQRASTIELASLRENLDRQVSPIQLNKFGVIAEIKQHSPAEGALTESGRSREQQALQYVAGGAMAISVLTEPARFSGAMSHLADVVAIARDVPVMRKDFLVDTRQIIEARAAGASGVLLITAMLSDEMLASMLDCAWEHSMFVLLEAFDANDLQRTANFLTSRKHADKAGQQQLLVGVNTRNLRTLKVDANRLEKLSGLLPQNAVCVAESGIQNAADVSRVVALGYAAVLVGTALMRSDEPQQLVAALHAAGVAA